MGKDGKRRINRASILRRIAPNHFQKLVWLPIEKLSEMFVQDINTNQINRLNDEQKATITRNCGEAIHALGYCVH
jgi:hypothetical protein